jgi:hypothetical protein
VKVKGGGQAVSLTDEDKLWITERLRELSKRVDGVSERVDSLTRYVLDFRTETIQRFEAIDRRLELLWSSFASIDSRLPALNKALVDFSALAGQFSKLVNPAA